MPDPIRILTDAEVADQPSRLDRAWDHPDTFVHLAEKSGVDPAWLASALDAVPGDFRRGHFILLTSGSTGTPKLVVGDRNRAEALTRVLHTTQDMEPVRETILSLPLTYCFAFVNQWLWARVHGRALRVTRGLADPAALAGAWRSARDAMICSVGTQATRLVELTGGVPCPGITRLHFAGGRFPQAHLPALADAFPAAAVYNNYGCAEAMPRLTLRPAAAAEDPANVGHPLPGVRLRAADDGRLEFQSAYGAVGFAHPGGFTPAPDWMETGDLAAPNPDGSWTLQGRVGEVFKRHGEKISLPAILERVRERYPTALAYRDTDPAGEAGYALVLSPPPERPRDALLLFRDHFPRAHWPLRLETAPTIPLLANGKPDITALRSLPDKTLIWKQHLS